MSSLVVIADLLSLCLRGALIGVMVKRGLVRSYPGFSAYLIFSTLSTIARLLVRNDYLVFFYLFWITEAVYAILSFVVIVEVFRRALGDLYGSRTFRFLLGFLGIVILAFTLAVPITRHVDAPPITAVILSVNLALRLLQVSVLALFLVFLVVLDLQRRRYELGIVVGYGFFAAVYLIVLALRSQLGSNYNWSVSLGHPIAYDCAALIWLLTFSRGERPAYHTGAGSRERLATQLGYLTDAHRRLSSKQWLG